MSKASFDIAVVGGGVAGVAAAYAAACDGRKVVLIDRNKMLGGLATNAEVGTICGLYSNDTSDSFVYNVGRFAEEFSREVQVRSESSPEMDRTGLKYLPYAPKKLKEVCEYLLDEVGVELILEAELREVHAERGRITSIDIEAHGEAQSYQIDALVDSSGVSRVSKLLGLDIIQTEFKQSASQVFTLEGIEFSSEKNLSLILLKALRIGVLNKEIEEYEDRIYMVPGSLKEDSVSLKFTVPAPMNEAFSKRELKDVASRSIEKVVAYLKHTVDGFSRVHLASIATAVGVRVGDRPIGKHILSENDVLGCEKSERTIAHGNWAAEIWSEAKRVELHHLKVNDYYSVPAGSLMSDKITNLFFAGRCISATDMAIASARVIGTCLQTGYAAGILASGSTQEESEKKIIERIQQEQFT